MKASSQCAINGEEKANSMLRKGNGIIRKGIGKKTVNNTLILT